MNLFELLALVAVGVAAALVAAPPARRPQLPQKSPPELFAYLLRRSIN